MVNTDKLLSKKCHCPQCDYHNNPHTETWYRCQANYSRFDDGDMTDSRIYQCELELKHVGDHRIVYSTNKTVVHYWK